MEKPKGKTKRRNQKEKLKGKINQRCQLLQCNVAMALSTGSQSTTFKILPKIPRTNLNMNTHFLQRDAVEECDCFLYFIKKSIAGRQGRNVTVEALSGVSQGGGLDLCILFYLCICVYKIHGLKCERTHICMCIFVSNFMLYLILVSV